MSKNIPEELSKLNQLAEKAANSPPDKTYMEFPEQIVYKEGFVLIRTYDCFVEYCSPHLREIQEVEELLKSKDGLDYIAKKVVFPTPGYKLFNLFTIVVDRTTYEAKVAVGHEKESAQTVFTTDVMLLVS